MVKMTDGIRVVTIPAGAVKQFTASGWKLADKQEQPKNDLNGVKNSGKVNIPDEPENPISAQEVPAKEDEGKENPESENELGNPEEENTKEENPEDKTEVEKLLEKPLGEMNTEELKMIANHFNIDHKGKTKQMVRMEIAEAMKQ